MFLLDFGLGKETIELVRNKALPEDGRILFPFSLGGETLSYEEMDITGRVKKADRGLFAVLPEDAGLPATAYFFRNVLEMLFFYDRRPKEAFADALLVAEPAPILAGDMDFLRASFRHLRNHVIVSSNDLYGVCRSIRLAGLADGKMTQITKTEETISVRVEGAQASYQAERFSFRRFARDFRIPKTTRELRPKGFRTFTEMYDRHSKRIRTG